MHSLLPAILLAASFAIHPIAAHAQGYTGLFGLESESIFIQLSAGGPPAEMIMKAPPEGHPDLGPQINLAFLFTSTPTSTAQSFSAGDVLRFSMVGCSRQFAFNSPASDVISNTAGLLNVGIPPGGLCAGSYNDQNAAGITLTLELLAGDGVKLVGVGIGDTIQPISSWNFGSNMILVMDTDGDMTPDHEDLDDDGDGLPDTAETGTGVFIGASDTGTDPLDADTDDDGASDGAEVAAGTNPLDPTSTPASAVPALGPSSLGTMMVLLAFAARRTLRGGRHLAPPGRLG